MSLTDHKRRWTQEELDILNSKLSNTAISMQIGRSRQAVAIKRCEIKNNYKEKVKAKKEERKEALPDYSHLKRDAFLIHADDIYFRFYDEIPLGTRIFYVTTKVDLDLRNHPTFEKQFVGEIIAKYPYYCKIRDIKTGVRKCIQWGDVARWNMELLTKEKVNG